MNQDPEWITDWQKNKEAKSAENKALLKQLSTIPKSRIWPIQAIAHKEVFDEVDCLACGNCCKSAPALLIQSDIKRISTHLGINKKSFERTYVIEDINGDKMLNKIPCSFLQQDNSCAIYEVRPEACRRYPHTDETEYHRRSKLNMANVMICPAAYKILDKIASQIDINPSNV